MDKISESILDYFAIHFFESKAEIEEILNNAAINHAASIHEIFQTCFLLIRLEYKKRSLRLTVEKIVELADKGQKASIAGQSLNTVLKNSQPVIRDSNPYPATRNP
jgi:penicillin-binding protein-related factor A (putative recombinase)